MGKGSSDVVVNEQGASHRFAGGKSVPQYSRKYVGVLVKFKSIVNQEAQRASDGDSPQLLDRLLFLGEEYLRVPTIKLLASSM